MDDDDFELLLLGADKRKAGIQPPPPPPRALILRRGFTERSRFPRVRRKTKRTTAVRAMESNMTRSWVTIAPSTGGAIAADFAVRERGVVKGVGGEEEEEEETWLSSSFMR